LEAAVAGNGEAGEQGADLPLAPAEGGDSRIPVPAGVERSSVRVARTAEDFGKRLHLFGAQLSSAAWSERRRVELAGLRVEDHPVDQRVVGVARREDRVAHHGKLGVGERAGEIRIAEGGVRPGGACKGLRIPGLGDRGPGQVHSRVPRDDAVEEVRVALREHEPFAPALGAADEIRILRALSVERLHQRLRRDRDLRRTVVAVVAPGLRIERELVAAGDLGNVGRVVVPAVGGNDRVAVLDRRRVGIAQAAVGATAAAVVKAPVPVGRHAQVEADRIRLAVGRADALVDRPDDLAMLRQRAGRVQLREGDLGVGQVSRRQRGAGFGR